MTHQNFLRAVLACCGTRAGWCVLVSAALAGAVLFRPAPAVAQPAQSPPAPSAAPPAAPATVPSAVPPAPPGAAPPAPKASSGEEPAEASADEAAKAEARAKARERNRNGIKLFNSGQFAAALAEFQAARRLHPTPGSLTGAGACLVKLQRYDEALDVFEAALRDYGAVLAAKTKEHAQEQVVVLRKATGAISITGPEVGATIVIDGRLRGEYPVPGPLNVMAGAHLVRVYKEGFAPFEKSLDVPQGQTASLDAKLQPLVRSGRLRVEESSGKALDVVVDGVPVGVSPWEGPLSVGDHNVLLRSQDNFGTLPSSVKVELNETTTVKLAAEQLGASIKVVPQPPTASVILDGFFVGRGTFEGRLRPGEHAIKVVADGYFDEAWKVSVKAGDEKALTVALRRDPDSPLWAEPGHFTIEASGGMALAPSFGGAITEQCTDRCSQDMGIGGVVVVSGGYEMANGFGFGITAGYLSVQQTTTDRPARLLPTGLDPAVGTATDRIGIQSFLAAAYGAYRIGERFPVRLRLSAGVGLGQVADTRTGTFKPTDPTITGVYDVGPLTQSGGTVSFFFSPEVHVGTRVVDKLEVSLGLSALFFVSPGVLKWNEKVGVNASSDGYATFDADAVTDLVVYAIAPGLRARYDF